MPYVFLNTPVQIHNWVGKVDNHTVADWVIAERPIRRGGGTIGRLGVTVEVPVWDSKRQMFRIVSEPGSEETGRTWIADQLHSG